MKKKDSEDIEILFDDGLPKGYDIPALERINIRWPEFYSVQPNTGSAGGTKLTIKASAVGVETDVTGWHFDVLLYLDRWTWVPLCDELTVVDYGTLTCTTVPMDMPMANVVRMTYPGAREMRCTNPDDD